MTPVVYYDPEDSDQERRFKMVFKGKYAGGFGVAYSPDGFRWKESPDNPVGHDEGAFEHSGLVKFNGCYFVNGQRTVHPHPVKGARKRRMVTYASCDFENWTESAALSFRRDNIPPRPTMDFEFHRGEQVHIGAGLWNRGNVILGFYRQYHNQTNDRRRATVDIGLIVSNDAIHFREPVPDFKIIPGSEESGTEGQLGVRLIQGQAFANIGDRTYSWYTVWDWPPGGDLRAATWEADRLGYFSPSPERIWAGNAHFVSCPIRLEKPDGAVFVNADGLSEYSYLTVEVLDEEFRRLPHYSREDSVPITASGFRERATWGGKCDLAKWDHPIRLRVNFEGLRAEDARVYAVYVSYAR